MTCDGERPGELRISINRRNSREIRIAVQGELDIASAPQLREPLQRELGAGARVLLDLSGVTFVDSTGLAAIVGALNGSSAHGGSLVLHPEFQPQVARLLELTGILSRLSEANS